MGPGSPTALAALLVALGAAGGPASGAADRQLDVAIEVDRDGDVTGVEQRDVDARSNPGTTTAAVHELHESYADLAIEGPVVGGQLRFFKKDLERALGPLLGSDAVSLSPGTEADALVLRYIRDRLTLVAGDTLLVAGDTLEATLLSSREIELGHHPGWEVTLAWQAAAPVHELRVRSTLLFELHADQRNIFRFVRFPDETRVTLTLEPGAAEGRVGKVATSRETR